MNSFCQTLQHFLSSGQACDLPDLVAFETALESNFSGWQSQFQALADDLRSHLEEAEEAVCQGFVDCLQAVRHLRHRGDAAATQILLDIHETLYGLMNDYHEQLWKAYGPTELSGINQIFWAYESWGAGQRPQEYFWHCVDTERKRLSYGRQAVGLEPACEQVLATLDQALEALLKLPAGQASESQLDLIQATANRLAEFQDQDPPTNWLDQLGQLLDDDNATELRDFVWRKLAEFHTIEQGLASLQQSTRSAWLQQHLIDLQELIQDMASLLQELLEDPDITLKDVEELNDELASAREDVLRVLDLQGRMACPNCARMVTRGSRQCSSCGARLPDLVDEEYPRDLGGPEQQTTNPNLAYLQAVCHGFVDNRFGATEMEAELQRWRKLLRELPSQDRLEDPIEMLSECVERLEAWSLRPSLGSLSSILGELEQALNDIAQAQPEEVS